MAAEKFVGSAPKQPSVKVSLPVKLFHNRSSKPQEGSSYPISCDVVSSTTGDYYGCHLSAQSPLKRKLGYNDPNSVGGNKIKQEFIHVKDTGGGTVKDACTE